MEAFSQHEKRHSMEMEIVATSWAFAQCDEKSDDDESDNPHGKERSHGFCGRRDVIGNVQCGNIDNYCSEKICAMTSCFPQHGTVRRDILRAFIHVLSSPPTHFIRFSRTATFS
jgi:hypothetical protein